jgi:hypothetical protein
MSAIFFPSRIIASIFATSAGSSAIRGRLFSPSRETGIIFFSGFFSWMGEASVFFAAI